MMGTEEDPGVTKQAIEQLFYAVEETPDRCFLMTVTSLSSAWILESTNPDLSGKYLTLTFSFKTFIVVIG